MRFNLTEMEIEYQEKFTDYYQDIFNEYESYFDDFQVINRGSINDLGRDYSDNGVDSLIAWDYGDLAASLEVHNPKNEVDFYHARIEIEELPLHGMGQNIDVIKGILEGLSKSENVEDYNENYEFQYGPIENVLSILKESLKSLELAIEKEKIRYAKRKEELDNE